MENKPAMTKKDTQNLFLEAMKKSKMNITLFLVNGIKLKGMVEEYDLYTILLNWHGHRTLVYKSALTSIMPNREEHNE